MTVQDDLAWLRTRMRASKDVRLMAMSAAEKVGADGINDFAASHPEEFALFVDQLRDLDDQMENLEDHVMKGLSTERRPL